MSSSHALFVDLPNFYSHLLDSGIDEPRVLRDYFLYWLDFDRLAGEIISGASATIWVFYSGRRFGPRSNRVHDEFLDNYIKRINSLKGVTARDVNIPGNQREPITYKCESCGQEGSAQWESEKGIDASLTVHLFDTMESWSVAYLLSGDADFVPAVASLRRRGKIVIGAGFSNASSALIRECYDYVNLAKEFLEEDVAAYQIFKNDGYAQKWLTDKVTVSPNLTPPFSNEDKQVFRVGYRYYEEDDNAFGLPGPVVLLERSNNENLDYSERNKIALDIAYKIGNMRQGSGDSPDNIRYRFKIIPSVMKGIERRFPEFISSIDGLSQSDEYVYSLKHQYNPVSKEFEVLSRRS